MPVFGSQSHIFKEQFTQQLLITSRCDRHLQMLWFWQHDVLCHKQVTNTSVEMAGMQTASLWPSPLWHHFCRTTAQSHIWKISWKFQSSFYISERWTWETGNKPNDWKISQSFSLVVLSLIWATDCFSYIQRNMEMVSSANYELVINLSFVKHSLQNDAAYCSDNIMNSNIIMSTVFMSDHI